MKSGRSPALQVSLPGVEVTTARFDQMAFDGRFAHLTLFLKGTVVVPNFGNVTIPFGRTFAAIPRLLCVTRANYGTIGVGTLHNELQGILTNHGSYVSWSAAQVTTSNVTFSVAVNDSTPSLQPYYARFMYYALYK
jgi:hypothetical protein